MKSVAKRSVSEIFGIDSKVIYNVPRYQREYAWTKRQWESLFDDVKENNSGYFLGSIICIDQSTDALEVSKLELVDGQQRLISLSLFFAAIYHALHSYKSDMDEDQQTELVNLKRKLILKKDDQLRLDPQVQGHNKSDYQAVLEEAGILKDAVYIAYAGNRKIFRAYRYFRDRIDEVANNSDDKSESILGLLEKVNSACLVKIEVESHADAYTLFESLNNRGLPLTAIDLIKNKLLAKLESFDKGGIDRHFASWNHLLERLGDDYSIQERFFRQYYNAFKEELKTIHQEPVATRSNLIKIYEKLINHDAKDCLQKISSASEHYSLILRNQDNGHAQNSIDKPLKDLDHIQGAPSYLLMLYLLSRKKDLQLSDSHLSSITSFLVRFFVRRNLTDMPPTRDLTRMFMIIIGELKDSAGDDAVQTIQQQLVAKSASDEIFQQKLEGPIYEENVDATRFILCALAEQSMTKETWLDLWRRGDKKLFVWSIEHIFPQGENIPQSWVDMIAGGDKERAKEIQQEYVHKLGNLTISGYNPTLGNKSFMEKRDRTDRKGKMIGYKNGLKLNEDMVGVETWGVTEIDSRTTKLVHQAMNLFKLQENHGQE